jgi:F-type H+-transporting ATPase subunit delta
VRESIRGYTEAVLEDADDLGSIADEVEAVDRLLDGSPDLRLVLADPGLGAHVRRAVIDDLLASQVSEATLNLLRFIIDADRAPDVVEDVEWLVRRARATSDGLRPVLDGPLGRVAATERVDGYASAVLVAVREDGKLGDVEDDLFRFSRVILGSEQLLGALTDPALPVEPRRDLVRDLLESKANPVSTRLAAYAVGVGRPRDYVALLDALVERVAAESNRQVAEVRAAVELTDEQQQRLGTALGRILGHDVDVRVIIDPSVLGGFIASAGDSIVDGSVRHRLEQLRERLVLPEANV